MKLRIFYGETKYGNVVECTNFEEAEKFIRDCVEKQFAILTFNDGKTPNIELKINGNFALLIYEGKSGQHHKEFEDYYDDEGLDEDTKTDMLLTKMVYAPVWIAQGNQSNPVKFLVGRFKKLYSSEAKRVITLEQAIECVKEFFKNKKRPESIKEWERLI